MFIKSIQIKNFRSFDDSDEIPFTQEVIFLGPNGSGKSNILKSIRSFFDDNAFATLEDFHNKNTDLPISITLTFGDLNQQELTYFGKYVRDGILTVEKRYSFSGGPTKGTYIGKIPQHKAFQEIRSLSGREKNNKYKEFRTSNSLQYPDLPAATSGTAVDQALTEWETNHPEMLELIEVPVPFFGARNVGGGSLDNYTRFVLVPAVRDASVDATDSKGSALTELVNILVKEVILQRQELVDFRNQTIEKYKELTSFERFTEIPELEGRLTRRLQTLVPKSAVHLLTGDAKEPVFSLPDTKAELTEDGYRGAIEGKGHGLQRSFIMSIIQELAIVQSQRDEQTRRNTEQQTEAADGHARIAADFRPDVILAIEEPELYQHPIRQQRFARVLAEFTLPDTGTTRPRIQVIMTSHSPFFVSIRRFGSIRLVLKNEVDGSVACSRVQTGDPTTACNRFCDAREITDPNVDQFIDGLRNIIDTRVSEAFFANNVLLVEGDDDKSAIEAAAAANDFDPIAEGIPIIPVDGKCNLSRVKVLLDSVGIRSFMVFDCDADKTSTDDIRKNKRENSSIMRLAGIPAEQIDPFPQAPIVTDTIACFPENLEKTLSAEISPFHFFERRSTISQERNLNVKSPLVYEQLLSEAYAADTPSKTLDKIVVAIKAMKQGHENNG
ncbi:MAG: ATP-dependent endonuclease [Nitrososphaerota archaeon]|nr:ATP-dependent endonuclease [Nitrososphaerota archaeon]